ncbi:uncharacterized protein LOC129724149 [Wyeomyia smithii]|uniref:uncharacterized protein LOC129724149 n=1 Tax=Wyeomyia smithii TaxID=174621 RepID=UPI0024682145|nr:uncharacterized protein LOC129724149 [Wyeomyia smithii]
MKLLVTIAFTPLLLLLLLLQAPSTIDGAPTLDAVETLMKTTSLSDSPHTVGTLPWFCSQRDETVLFLGWLKSVVQVWLPPALCSSVNASGGESAPALKNLFGSNSDVPK